MLSASVTILASNVEGSCTSTCPTIEMHIFSICSGWYPIFSRNGRATPAPMRPWSLSFSRTSWGATSFHKRVATASSMLAPSNSAIRFPPWDTRKVCLLRYSLLIRSRSNSSRSYRFKYISFWRALTKSKIIRSRSLELSILISFFQRRTFFYPRITAEYLIYALTIVNNILNLLTARTAWGSLAGMIIPSPLFTIKGLPEIRISASPSNTCTRAS